MEKMYLFATDKSTISGILDSNNIFTYAGLIKDNVNKHFSVWSLKNSYDILKIVKNNYDKVLWVSLS